MMSLQKAEHADVECVVAITGDHVAGLSNPIYSNFDPAF